METTQIPTDLQGASIFFAMLDSGPRQVNSFEKLEMMQHFIDQAQTEFARLNDFAVHTAANPVTASLAAQMAEAWGYLYQALVDRQFDLRRMLMAGGAQS